jgi:tetratricopeptide (TPR) repeat protein
MADSVVDAVLGGDDQQLRAAEAKLAEADATAMAVALDIARTNPEAAREAASYLKHHAGLVAAQTQLVRLQLRHFNQDRVSGDRALARRRVSELMKNTLQALATVAGLGFTALLGVMLYDAVTSHAVVVEAFDTPPALAPAGISGRVVASGVLDALQHLANATRAASEGLAAQSARSSDVKIVVPEAGVSIGEIERVLHQRFGRDLHVGGDLIQTPGGGLALTVRGDTVQPKTFAGAAGDLPRLSTQAAEYIYGSSQPVHLVYYLTSAGRNDEALAFVAGAFPAATNDTDRSKLAEVWGSALFAKNKIAEAAEKWRVAIALDPENWTAHCNLPAALLSTEGEEAAYRASRDFLRIAADAPAAHRPPDRLLSNAAQDVWDLPLYLKAELADAAHNGGSGATSSIDGPAIADAYASMHDWRAAERYQAGSDPSDWYTKAEALLLQAYAAFDRNDPAAAVPPLETFWRAWQSDSNLQSELNDSQCFLGLAYGLSGRLTDAEAFFKKAGAWNRCYAFHGDALAHAGDIAGANRVWADGEHLAPDMPIVPLHRGLSELARGELIAAATDFARAHSRAPHFADPLKAWGDLLAREGKWNDAVAKYNQALEYAQNWDALKAAREAAVNGR